MVANTCQLQPRFAFAANVVTLGAVMALIVGCPKAPEDLNHQAADGSARLSSRPLASTPESERRSLEQHASQSRLGLVISLSGVAPGAPDEAETLALRRRLVRFLTEGLSGVAQIVDLSDVRADAVGTALDVQLSAELRGATVDWLQGSGATALDGVVVVAVDLGVADTVRARGVSRKPLEAGETVELVARRATDLEAVALAAVCQVLPFGARVVVVDADTASLRLELPLDQLLRFSGSESLVFAQAVAGGRGSSRGYVVVGEDRESDAGEPLVGRVVALPSQVLLPDSRVFRVRLRAGTRRLEVREAVTSAAAAGLAVWAGEDFESLSFRGVTDAEGRFELRCERPEPVAVAVRRTVGETQVDLGRRVVVAGDEPVRLAVRSGGRLLAELVQQVAERERLLDAVRTAVADGLGDIYEGHLDRAEQRLALAERDLEALGESSVEVDLARQLKALRGAVARAEQDRRSQQLLDLGEQLLGSLRYREALEIFDQAVLLGGNDPDDIARRQQAREVVAERAGPRGQARERIHATSIESGDLRTGASVLDDLVAAIEVLSLSSRTVDYHLLDRLAVRLETVYSEFEDRLAAETGGLQKLAAAGGGRKAVDQARGRVLALKERGKRLLLVREKIDEALRSVGAK